MNIPSDLTPEQKVAWKQMVREIQRLQEQVKALQNGISKQNTGT